MPFYFVLRGELIHYLGMSFACENRPVFLVYHSNQLDVLKSLLVEIMRHDPLASPFDSEHILVQSPGMSQWLKMALAQDIGIAANVQFPLPATFIWRMFTQVLEGVPARSEFNKEAMTWRLWELLPQVLSQEAFAPLKAYLIDDDKDVKRYQLAEKIADLFDQYLVYRPDWIAQWEQGELVAELDGSDDWQGQLWAILYEHTLSLGVSHYHRGNMYQSFIEQLGDLTPDKVAKLNLPKRLFVFGVSALPPRYIDALMAIGQHIDVHFMLTNPCRYYWGDIQDRNYLIKLEQRDRRDRHRQRLTDSSVKFSEAVYEHAHWDSSAVGNSLLASMGKMGRDNLSLLVEKEATEIEVFVEPPTGEPLSLLAQIQHDVLNLTERQDDRILDNSQHKCPVSLEDDSVSLHACHSPMREVEVLHDQLLHWFAQDPTLTPRDVIVMVADINAYSPAIQAVFGNAPSNRFIPFSISDRTADQENPILLAFLTLLSLPERRCTASELLELLEVPAVMRRFGFNESQFSVIKRWVEESGVRWGLNAHTAEEFDLPSQQQNTWLFGIQRMLLGYAMPSSVGLFQGMAAYDQVQGLEANLAGQLAAFVSKLQQYQQTLSNLMSPMAWQQALLGILDDFFDVDVDGEVMLTTIRDGVGRLCTQLSHTQVTEISPEIVRQYLQENLASARVSQRFLAGQVNFCTLMPMRSIPFKVVCLLGMNEGTYPRNLPPEGFDLMNGRWRKGDRSRRDDDRYLFLEAFLSAEQRLYISYVGRSIKDNERLSPSVLVSEFLAYCGHNFRLSDDEEASSDDAAQRLKAHLCVEHPLVPFSPSAFMGKHQSYASEWVPAAQRAPIECAHFSDHPLPFEDITTVSLAEFQRFWRLPVQHFFERRLKVYLRTATDELENDEPFTLQGLEGYSIRDRLLSEWHKARKHGTGESEYHIEQRVMAELRAMGKLPIGNFGELGVQDQIGQSRLLWLLITQHMSVLSDDVEVSIALPTDVGILRLEGWLSQVYDNALIRYRTGHIRPQDRLRLWIDHLCWHAMGGSGTSYLFGFDEKRNTTGIAFSSLSPDDALLALSELMNGFVQGMQTPVPYFPKTVVQGLVFDKKTQTLEPIEKCDWEAMMKAFESDDEYNQGEGLDPYVQRVWASWRPSLGHEVMAFSYPIWAKLLPQCKEVKVEEVRS